MQDSAVYDPGNFAWSNGAHACEVEVDRDTGEIHILGYWGVDDVGTVINPMIVEGQIQGGIAQGLGQALREHCFYEPDSGQLLSGSFMDYAVPRASDMPDDRLRARRKPALHPQSAGRQGLRRSWIDRRPNGHRRSRA